MSKLVLFLCHHGAAKSVLGAAYFRKAVGERGLDLEADFAGTEPDDDIAPHVAAHLAQEGLQAPPHEPRLLTQADLRQAAKVISLGCPLDGFDLQGVDMEHWEYIPAPSEDLVGAAQLIEEKANALVADLARSA